MDDTVQGLNASPPFETAGPTTILPPPPRDDAPSHPPGAVLSLKQAMRRARFDDAERSGAVADLRAARLGRLEVLHEALRPLIAQIPADVDCFDVAIMPGANPRLFIDMIGFVEMARDPRVYVFIQDKRHGRIKIAESESSDRIVEAVTQYVARRLLERDKALAADDDEGAQQHAEPARAELTRKGMARESMARESVAGHASSRDADARADPIPPRRAAPTRRRRRDQATLGSILAAIFAFLIDVLGSIAFFSILAGIAWILWQNFNHP